jgi:cysteine desulfurase
MKVYLDNNATTPLAPEVALEMKDSMENFGNPSSLHGFGAKAKNILETARRRVAASLRCDPDEIVFTSGGTESDNLAIQGYLRSSKKKHIITSKTEHHAVLNVFKHLEGTGYRVSWIGTDRDGIIDPDDVAGELTGDTAIVSIMLANNEMGAVQPVKEIAARIKEHDPDIMFHTDAVQGFGKIKFNVRELGADLLSISAHKINGPKGAGALCIRKGVRMKPVCFGGHHERGIRPGTEDVCGIAGLGKAAELTGNNIDSNIEKLLNLRNRLMQGIQENIENIKVNGSLDNIIPNTLNVSFKNIEGESIIMMLDMQGIAVSTGSACTSGSLEPSHVLTAMGVDPATAQGSIRFSLGKYNTEQEIDYVIEKLPPIAQRLREMSPLEVK